MSIISRDMAGGMVARGLDMFLRAERLDPVRFDRTFLVPPLVGKAPSMPP